MAKTNEEVREQAAKDEELAFWDQVYLAVAGAARTDAHLPPHAGSCAAFADGAVTHRRTFMKAQAIHFENAKPVKW